MRLRPAALLVLAALGLAACQPKAKAVKKPRPAAAPVSAADARKVEAHYIEGVYAYAEGDTAKAVAAWKKALAIDPRHAPSLKAMAEAKAKMDAVKKLKN